MYRCIVELKGKLHFYIIMIFIIVKLFQLSTSHLKYFRTIFSPPPPPPPFLTSLLSPSAFPSLFPTHTYALLLSLPLPHNPKTKAKKRKQKMKQGQQCRRLTDEELFYDPHMDEEDEQWVKRQRMAYHNGICITVYSMYVCMHVYMYIYVCI